MTGTTLVDDRTLILNMPLPAQANRLEDNIERIRASLVVLDSGVPIPSTTPAPEAAAPASRDGVIALTDEMNALYGASGWSMRAGTNPGTDIGPALLSACDKLRAKSGRGTIEIGPGNWLLVAGVSADKLAGITISGAGSMATIITYANTDGIAFGFSGAGGFTGGGLRGLCIYLAEGLGDTNATAISLQGSASFQPDQFRLSDVYVTAGAGSFWYDGLRMFGNARTSPQGIRNTVIDSVQIFACRNTGAYLSNVVQLTGSSLGVYTGKGLGRNIYIAGGGSPSTNSIQVNLVGVACNELNVTNTSRFSVAGVANTYCTDASATQGDVTLYGAVLVGSVSPTVLTRF